MAERPIDIRRASVASMAMSEASRADLVNRANNKKTDPEEKVIQIPQQVHNYFKNVAENKETNKLLSLLSTSINSTKKVSNCYAWRVRGWRSGLVVLYWSGLEIKVQNYILKVRIRGYILKEAWT